MEVRSLSVQGFRNLALDKLALHPRLNLITGRNGQGKTNLLEALAVVSGRSSFRTADPCALLRDGAGTATVACTLGPDPSEPVLGALLAAGRREHQRDGRRISRLIASRALPLVLLTDSDLHRLAGPPADRRRALDRAVHALEPAHHADVAELEKLRAARTRLLVEPRPDPDEVAAFAESFARAGARVAASRRRVLPALATSFRAAAERLGSPYADLELALSSDLPVSGTEDDLRAALLDLVTRRAAEERRAGRALFGPHRDDVHLRSGRLDVAARASSGERRTLVLAWSLAERDLLARRDGTPPVFAFDDFDSEWDLPVLSRFLRELPGTGQLLLTSARPETLARLSLPDGLTLVIEDGTVRSPSVPWRAALGTTPPEGPPHVSDLP